jgi:hypothetical protein
MKFVREISLLILASLTGCSSRPWTPYDFPVDVSEQLKHATVKVRSYGMPGCSGVFISPAIVLTASHCVYSGLNIEVSRFATPENFVSGSLIFNHPNADISVLKVAPEPNDTAIRIKADPTAVDDEIVATVGHPIETENPYNPFALSSSSFRLSTGMPLWLKENELAVSIRVQPGNSGGGLITNKGEIVGVMSKFGPDPYQFPKFETVGFFAGGPALRETNIRISRSNVGNDPELPWTEAESKLYTSLGAGYRTERNFSASVFPTIGLSFRYAERFELGLGTAVDFNHEFDWYFGRMRAFKLFGTGYASFLFGAGLFCDKGTSANGGVISPSCRPEFTLGIPGVNMGIQIAQGDGPILGLIEIEMSRWYSSLGY